MLLYSLFFFKFRPADDILTRLRQKRLRPEMAISQRTTRSTTSTQRSTLSAIFNLSDDDDDDNSVIPATQTQAS